MIGEISLLKYRSSKPRKNYGIIRGKDGNEYWFPLLGYGDLETGMIVSFEGERDEKGLVAREVKAV